MTPVRALTRTVVIDGEVFVAGDVPPAHIADRIRNPACWAPVTPEAGPNWTPEAGTPDPVRRTNPAPAAVVEPDPAPAGLRNLEPQDPATGSSAVIEPVPGVINGAPAPEPPADPDWVLDPDRPAEPALEEDYELDPPQDPGAEPGLLPEPPRAGRGATTNAWRTFAEQYGVEVPAGADRSDIIALLKDDGHIQ